MHFIRLRIFQHLIKKVTCLEEGRNILLVERENVGGGEGAEKSSKNSGSQPFISYWQHFSLVILNNLVAPLAVIN